jgi:hypothetical protein
VDKHGLSRHAYNLEIEMDLEGQVLTLGLDAQSLPSRQGQAEAGEVPGGQQRPAPSADELIGDLASLLQKRSAKTIIED